MYYECNLTSVAKYYSTRFYVHAQIGVGYALVPAAVRSDVSDPPPVGLSQLVTSIMKMASTLPVSENTRRR